jgi:hypothetical protein
MSEIPDWAVWPLAVAVVALFVWYFWHTARTMFEWFTTVVRMIQNWPQTRRAMVEVEARAGGRYPWWYRAARLSLVLAMVLFAAYFIYRLFQ